MWTIAAPKQSRPIKTRTFARCRPLLLFAVLLGLCHAPMLFAEEDEYDDIGTNRAPNAQKWGALRWLKSEQDSFQGRPKMSSDSDTNNYITIAYDRYVSYYDLRNSTPRWVAYATDRSSANVTELKTRSGAAFARPKQFFTDGILALASKHVGVEPTEHFDFSDRVPEGLSSENQVPRNITAQKARSFPAIIERGHLAPNNTMKTWGTIDDGKRSQFESFSLANVVPQMSAHNAPTWSALEAQCLKWAKEFGTACVVAGPIYSNSVSPRVILDRRTHEKLEIPFPDALFCVVIAKRAGKTAAIGFIMPHIVEKYSFTQKAVPIDHIEQVTGINFMPRMGEPNILETTVDQLWLRN